MKYNTYILYRTQAIKLPFFVKRALPCRLVALNCSAVEKKKKACGYARRPLSSATTRRQRINTIASSKKGFRFLDFVASHFVLLLLLFPNFGNEVTRRESKFGILFFYFFVIFRTTEYFVELSCEFFVARFLAQVLLWADKRYRCTGYIARIKQSLSM